MKPGTLVKHVPTGEQLSIVEGCVNRNGVTKTQYARALGVGISKVALCSNGRFTLVSNLCILPEPAAPTVQNAELNVTTAPECRCSFVGLGHDFDCGYATGRR
jgi:hypothetical protein